MNRVTKALLLGNRAVAWVRLWLVAAFVNVVMAPLFIAFVLLSMFCQWAAGVGDVEEIPTWSKWDALMNWLATR